MGSASFDLAGEIIAGALPKPQLRLTFKDGTVGDVSLVDHEWTGISEPLADPALFAQVRVDPEARTIVWPNGFDMAPEPLYEKARPNRVRPAAAASPGAFCLAAAPTTAESMGRRGSLDGAAAPGAWRRTSEHPKR